ncbi:filamentous hemagglutinin N-terminal domain-containing protein [Pseudomonas sp. NFACC45]|uniref:two-partner secretion domain-containing protein n=1 Tax=Pseudomonas sp. NFACC45 TaxID=1566201 RepID=UPI0008ED3135|nr:filamentous hemagglutinin N-terminal domain-containing protein [Pseudomonas sp. NFACC45]SFH27400.1 filamentous hemagglutinin family N-terminal domain-containing protein [Pseudomonas sp. NFACC45]
MDDRQHAFLARQPSAVLKNREHFWGMPKRGLAFLLANVMFWQPLWAQAEGIVVSAPGTGLDRAGNGVPIVNIAAPNGSGLSHNQFKDYNVGSNGVILNNATNRTQSTQLGGIILGNPNLNGTAAKTILNEVNGGNPSQLRGYTEVAGQSAHVIVANPYGITCNGCGFINSPKVTLSTGKPVVENGRLDRYQVDKGSVAIEGAGLNANNVDHFEIITRSAKINAEIQAKNLTIIAGRNDVNATTLNATARADDGSAKPQLAIDSSALGGMYAGAIKLVGTEAGVGVKLDGKLIASGGDIQLDANGHLSLVDTSATDAVKVKAASLDARGPVYAGTTLNAQTQGNLTNQKTLAARNTITLSAGGQLSNNGIIEAGVNADNSRNAAGDVSLAAQTLNNNGKSIVASRNLTANVAQTLNNQGGTLSAGQTATVKAGTLDNQNKGRVLSNNTLNVTADKLLNTQGIVSSNGNLKANVGQLNNHDGEVSSAAATQVTGATLDNSDGLLIGDVALNIGLIGALNNQSGVLGSGKSLTVTATSLDNTLEGSLVSDGSLTARISGLFDNRQGSLGAKGMADVQAGSLDNRLGKVQSVKDLQLTVARLDNRQQGLLSSQAALRVDGSQLDNRGGLLSAVGPVHLQTTEVDNSGGRISSKTDLAANVAQLTNQGGELVAQGLLTVSGQNLDNRNGGLVGATKALKVDVDALDNRGGEISSTVGINITGQNLNNSDSGKILAGTDLGLKVAAIINQSKGLLFSAGATTLEGQSLDNSDASLVARLGLDIRLDNALTNVAGLISSDGALSANTGTIDNTDGSLTSVGAMTLTPSGALVNRGGTITTDAGLSVTSQNLDNRNEGLLSAKGATRVTTGTFDNTRGGYLVSGDTLDLTAAQVSNGVASRIASDKALTASVTGLDQQGGELFSKTALTLDLNNGQLNNLKGVINAPLLVLKNLRDVDNRGGEISSAQAFTLAAQNLDNRDGKLINNQALTLRIDQALNNIKGLVSAQSIDTHSASLDNTDGLISSRGALVMTVDGQLINRDAAIIADGDLHIEATNLDNSAGQIAGKTDVTADITTANNQSGQMIALGALTLTGTSLDNRAAGLVGATDTLTLNVDSIDNRGGELSGHADVAVTGDALDNSDGGQVLANAALALTVKDVLNRTKGLLSGKTGLTLTGETLDNSGGALLTQKNLTARLDGDLNNAKGTLSAEGALEVTAVSFTNTQGSVSSAGALALTLDNALLNQGGEIVTDAGLTLKSASLDNRNKGSISAKQAVLVETGAFDNSQAGRLSSGANLDLTTKQLTNQDGGRIASSGALTASATGLDQQGGQLFSNTALTLDLNQGQLNNQSGLINAPLLMLKNLKGVNNAGGEISSAQAFTLAAQNLNNDNGKLLSNQALTLRVDNALTNLKGLIAAAAVDVGAASLDNSGGTLTSRANLDLKLTGPLINQNRGLINAADALNISTSDLNNHQGSLLGSAIAIDFGAATGDLNNSAGLITTAGVLSLKNLRDLNNQGGEISSSQNLNLTARDLNISTGKLISNGLLTVGARDVINQGGLMSGFKGIDLNAASLDNRNAGTLSSRDEDVGVTLSGALFNSADGALASKKKLTVSADSVDNRDGILSSGADQTLTVTGGLLNNAQGGLIDSGATLVINAITLGNAGGTVNAQNALSFTGTTLDNSGGNLIGNAAVTLDLLGALTNTNGKLASVGPLRVERATQINNQGGQIASQSLLTLLTGGLDNRNRGTVAANDQLILTTPGAVQNSADGLIYSQNGAVQIDAVSLANGKGTVQSQGNLVLTVGQDIDNQSGRIQAKAGDVTVEARHFDNRGGVLASLQGLLKTDLTGVLKNGYDLNNNRQGGITQAQRLNLIALGGLDNYGGRISAQTGDATVTTGNFDNRTGGLYAKGKVNVTGNNFDNSGDNDGQIAGSQIDLNLTGALNNRQGIIESDSTLAIKAASLDNQTGQIRALGASGKTNFQIGGLFDNRNGVLESANTDLSLGVGNLLNEGGKILHVGSGNFGVATTNVINAGGSFVTRGALTLSADSWTNTSVLQAGTLNVNVNNFTQTATGQLLATTALVGSGGNWRNDGLIASDGSLTLNLGGTYSGNGRASSLGTLGLTAGQLNLTSVGSIAGGGTTSVSSSGQLNNYGRITSNAALTANAGVLNNYGTLGSGQNLTVNASSLLNDHGLIFSGGNMALRVTEFNNLYADVYSLGGIDIAADSAGGRARLVSNRSSTMESAGDFSLSATTFENTKDRFAYTSRKVSGALGVVCLRDCWTEDNKYRTFYGSGTYVLTENFEAVASEDSASSFLTSGGNVRIAGSKISNLYSTISATGNISITADDFQNQAAQVGPYSVKSTYDAPNNMTSVVTDDFFFYNQRNNPDFPAVEYEWHGEIYGGKPREIKHYQMVPVAHLVPRSDSGTGGYVEVFWFDKNYEVETEISLGSQPYLMYARSGMNDDDTYFHASSLYDKNHLLEAPAWLNSTPLISREVTGGLSSTPAVIQAGGQVSINASASINNSLITPFTAVTKGGDKTSSTAVSPASQAVFIPVSLLPPELRQSQVNPLALPGFSLPTGQNGLFRLSGQGSSTPVASGPNSWTLADASLTPAQRQQALPNAVARDLQLGNNAQPNARVIDLSIGDRQVATVNNQASTFDTSTSGDAVSGVMPARSSGFMLNRVQGLPSSTATASSHKYLIETNPVLTELKQFMSSDYLLTNLGYNPDESAKRLGDGLYEQRLIQQAVLARTGQRYIDGQTTDEGLFKYLMNNAVASKDALNLSLGVTLTAEQVAALTHDIVWLEEHEVNGEKVLVPVLYLANANQRLAANGALIQGKDVSLIAGKDLTNSGTLRASENLAAIAGTDLVNSGLIEAGNRLDLLAGNDLVNKAGGIISGRDVSLSALKGDVINERSVHTYDSEAGRWDQHREFLDNVGRIEAANDLTIKAGRDVANIGSTLQAGRDMSISAGRDVIITSATEHNTEEKGKNDTKEQITQFESRLTAGRDISIDTGRNLAIVASQLEAKRDIAMAAIENVTVSSAADEEHSFYKTKRITDQKDHVSQVQSSISAGGDVGISAGKDMALISSRITAGDEAYLVAGGDLELLAAQDRDYSLYSRKNKTGFGTRTQRDEVTKVTHVGSEINTGGDLTIVSNGDQTYQVAKLGSGNDLVLNSGGSIIFEGVKDLVQESHEKSSTSLAWNSMKGKGHTDETLRQSQLIANGDVVIKAVDGLNIDIKDIDRNTVSQTIDAMVKADPQLSWLKDAEQRGDVDWRLVKETHESFKYSSSSLGQGAMLAIVIIVTVLTAGAASAAVGSAAGATAGSGTAMAAAGTASASAVAGGAAVGSTVGAGLGNMMASAVLTSMASNAAVSVINNQGNLGATFKDITSSEAMKGYLTSAAMIGVSPGYNPAALGFNLPSLQAVLLKSASDAFVNTVINGGSYTDNLGNALASQASNVGMAVGFKMVGDYSLGKYQDGSIQKVLAHALMGGLLAEATGSDFKTGAIAAGANEALINVLSTMVGGNKQLESMASQLTGLVAAAAVGGDLSKGAEIAQYATAYNRQLHYEEQKWLEENAKTFAQTHGITEQVAMERLSQQALKNTDYLWRSVLSDGDDSAALAFLSGAGKTFVNDLGEKQALFTATGQQLFRPEMFADTTDPAFYKRFVQSGVSRELSAGLTKELKDSGIAIKDGAINLYDAVRDNPGAVVDGLMEGIKGLPQSALDSFREGGNAIGEGAAVALEPELAAKLNAIYGLDVSTAQQALLLIRTVSAVSMAGTGVKVGGKLTEAAVEAVGKKLDEVLNDAAEKALYRSGGLVGSDGLPVLDLKELTSDQKRVIGEVLGETTVRKIVPEGQKLARMQGAGETGIDDLYRVNRTDVDFVVIEYKFVGDTKKGGNTSLINTDDGKQGSTSWTLGSGRLEKAVGEQNAPDIRRAIEAGRTETWVVRTGANGFTEIQVLDALGKPKPIDTSKILAFKTNVPGAQP